MKRCGSEREAEYWARRLNREELRHASDLRAYATDGDLEGLTQLLQAEMPRKEELLWALGGKETVRQMPPWASDQIVDFFVKMNLSDPPFKAIRG